MTWKKREYIPIFQFIFETGPHKIKPFLEKKLKENIKEREIESRTSLNPKKKNKIIKSFF